VAHGLEGGPTSDNVLLRSVRCPPSGGSTAVVCTVEGALVACMVVGTTLALGCVKENRAAGCERAHG
jgi:hypothetical protein